MSYEIIAAKTESEKQFKDGMGFENPICPFSLRPSSIGGNATFGYLCRISYLCFINRRLRLTGRNWLLVILMGKCVRQHVCPFLIYAHKLHFALFPD